MSGVRPLAAVAVVVAEAAVVVAGSVVKAVVDPLGRHVGVVAAVVAAGVSNEQLTRTIE